ncbi:DUF881 domain-containing protein [Nocardioidaceae bacterium]|nr:DUF881 domain-containing protein [Nocardioidaceae bacterium]
MESPSATRHSPALLDMLADTALDADYARAADQGGRPPRPGLRLLVVVLLGIMTAVGIVQTARSEPAARQGRADLVAQLAEGQDGLAARRTRLAGLERDLRRLSDDASALAADRLRVLTQEQRAERLAAARPESGPGLLVVADDAPDADAVEQRVLDKDLQRLVNGLWTAGARAVAVNGVRLSALSSIRTAGEAVTVDYRSVRPPYEVIALGDANELETGFVTSTHGRYWYELEQAVGVILEVEPRERLSVPPAQRLGLRQAVALTAPGPVEGRTP